MAREVVKVYVHPVYFRITIGLLASWLVFGVGLALLLALNARSINRDGGWGFILAAGVFVAVTAFVGLASTVSAALSLRRGEGHRRLTTALLIGNSLVVLALGPNLVLTAIGLGRQYAEAGRQPKASPRPAGQVRGSEIPRSLLQHFERHGIVLQPAGDGGHSREWTVTTADLGTRCEVITSFRGYAHATPVEVIREHLNSISTPSVLNEQARLAMFHPHARGTTKDVSDCQEWAARSAAITEPLLAALRSYRPETRRGP